jgi:replicative DNA helicase
MIESSTVLESAIDQGLLPVHFTYMPHREIYTVILDLYKTNEIINELNIYNKNKKLENTLTEIISTSPVTNVSTYINSLFENHKTLQIDLFAKKLLNVKDNLKLKEQLLNEYIFSHTNQLKNDEVNIVPLGKITPKKIEFICGDYLPVIKKTCTLVIAPGDTGKTFLALKNALHYKLKQIKDKTFKKCFCWLSEDDNETVIKNRELDLINTLFNDEEKKLLLDPEYEDLIYVSNSSTFPFMHLENYAPVINPNLFILKQKLKDFEYIVLDPLSNFYGGDENDNYYAKQFMNIISNWAKDENKAIMILHNTPSAAKTKARGAEAIRDAAKVSYVLKKILDKEGLPLQNTNKLDIYIEKDNYNLKTTIKELYKEKYQENKKTFRLEVFPKKGV